MSENSAPQQSAMKESWKGLLVISAVVIFVPWYMSGFDPQALGYWVQVAMALVLGGVLVTPIVNFVERKISRGAAILAALLVLPELVLFLHFYVLTSLFTWLES